MHRSATLAARLTGVMLTLLLIFQVVQPRTGTAFAQSYPLTVSKTVSDLTTGQGPSTTITAHPGDTLEYFLSYNYATSTATGLTLSDTVNTAAQTVISNSCSPTPCSDTSNPVTFTPATPTGTATFEVTVNAGFSGSMSNSFTASAPSATPSTATSSLVTVNVTTATTTLSASKTVQNLTTGLPSPPGATASASPGQSVRFFLNYANTGPSAASVTLTDTLPAGFGFIGCAPTPCSASGATVTYGPYSTASGGGGQATLDAQVTGTVNGPISNVFSASAPGAVTVSSAAATVGVSGSIINPASLSIDKQVADVTRAGPEATGISAVSGDRIRYSFLINSSALQPGSTGVVLTDTLQPGQTFANNCSVSCTYDGVNTVRLAVGNINPGTSTTVTFDATVNATTTNLVIQNTASAAGTNTAAATSNTTAVVVSGAYTPAPPACTTGCYNPVGCPTSCLYTPPYNSGTGTCGYYYSCNGCATIAYGCVGSAYSRTLTVCGTVQSYQAASGQTGYITINNEAFVLMPYLVASGSAVTVGTSYCFTFTVNANCQIIAMTVSVNIASANYVCGTVTPYNYGYAPYTGYTSAGYMPYPGYNPYGQYSQYGPYQYGSGNYGWQGPMVVGGYPYQVSSSFGLPYTVSYGNPYCFIVNQAGAVNGSLSVTPTAATAVESPSGTHRAHGTGSI